MLSLNSITSDPVLMKLKFIMGMSIWGNLVRLHQGEFCSLSLTFQKNFLTLVFDSLFTHIVLFFWRSFLFIIGWERTQVWPFLSIIWVSFLVRLDLFSSSCQSFVSSLPILKNFFFDKREEKFYENKFKFVWWQRKDNESVKEFWRVSEIGGLTVLKSWNKSCRYHNI